MKKFECNWGNWEECAIQSYEPKREIVDEDFFGELPNRDDDSPLLNSMGYKYDDLISIQNLQLSETWHCAYGNHTVTRIH